jgi:hypothetical protein
MTQEEWDELRKRVEAWEEWRAQKAAIRSLIPKLTEQVRAQADQRM